MMRLAGLLACLCLGLAACGSDEPKTRTISDHDGKVLEDLKTTREVWTKALGDSNRTLTESPTKQAIADEADYVATMRRARDATAADLRALHDPFLAKGFHPYVVAMDGILAAAQQSLDALRSDDQLALARALLAYEKAKQRALMQYDAVTKFVEEHRAEFG